MNRRFLRILAVAGGAAALLLGLAACGADVAPVENRVGAVEQDMAKVKGDIGAVKGDVGAVKGDVDAVKGEVAGLQGSVGKLAAPAGEVRFFVTALEFKGGTSVEDLAPPDLNPADLSDGYELKAPGSIEDDPTRWEVSSYAWNPAAMTVLQGTQVSLSIFATNGDEHKVWIEAPDGSEALPETVMNRGREYDVGFSADQAGTYILHCDNHDPTMTGIITVLPRAEG